MKNLYKQYISVLALMYLLCACAVPTPVPITPPIPLPATPQLPGPTVTAPPAQTTAVPAPFSRINRSFNPDWKYLQGDAGSAEAQTFDDSAWTYVDLPHATTFVTPENPKAYLGVS